MPIKTLVLLVLFMLFSNVINGQNYIRYHQRSLKVQELMLNGDTLGAFRLLERLEKRYGLMPTETFARASCQATLGDTAAARRSYLRCLEQHGLLVWLHVAAPPLRSADDSLWYAGVIADAGAYRQAHPDFVDGPFGSIPTVLTSINREHDQFMGSPNGHASDPESETMYRSLKVRHDAVLDSMIAGLLPVFSVSLYGVNTEFQTLIHHATPAHVVARRKHFRRWLKEGLIYPDDYAVSVDGPAYRQGRPMRYKIYRSMDDDRIKPGYEKRRWRIGMGDDRLHALRFHRPG